MIPEQVDQDGEAGSDHGQTAERFEHVWASFVWQGYALQLPEIFYACDAAQVGRVSVTLQQEGGGVGGQGLAGEV
jgi:hypothetical protein